MKYVVVARWEFLEKVKSKAFIISLVAMPVIMVGLGVMQGFMATKADEKTVSIGIIDETGQIFQPLAARLDEKYKLPNGQPNYVLKNLKDDREFETLKSRANKLVASDEIGGYFHIPASVNDSGDVEYRSSNVGNIRIQERFSRTIEEVVVERRVASRGLDPKMMRSLMKDVNVKSIKVNEKGEEKESGFLETFFRGYIVIMMLLFLVLTSGQLLIRSVVEEKSNRVIEVLLSSCSAKDLMAGKILGLSGLGVLQVLIWGAIGLGVSISMNASISAPEEILLSLLYFILGYLLYSAVFVAAGSPVTTEQEAQQITSYVSLLLVFPIFVAVPVMQNPESMIFRVLSFIPLLTPTIMVMRIAVQMPPAWEIFSTLGLLLVSVVVMMWAAGKIFRIAILVYGKRPSIAELVRWIRAA